MGLHKSPAHITPPAMVHTISFGQELLLEYVLHFIIQLDQNKGKRMSWETFGTDSDARFWKNFSGASVGACTHIHILLLKSEGQYCE